MWGRTRRIARSTVETSVSEGCRHLALPPASRADAKEVVPQRLIFRRPLWFTAATPPLPIEDMRWLVREQPKKRRRTEVSVPVQWQPGAVGRHIASSRSSCVRTRVSQAPAPLRVRARGATLPLVERRPRRGAARSMFIRAGVKSLAADIRPASRAAPPKVRPGTALQRMNVMTTKTAAPAAKAKYIVSPFDVPKVEMPKFDAPKMEVPAAFRRFAQQGVDQAKDNYGKGPGGRRRGDVSPPADVLDRGQGHGGLQPQARRDGPHQQQGRF